MVKLVVEQDLQRYWNEEIRLRFEDLELEAKVRILDGSQVRYVNLDNAATTKPFKSVKERVNRELNEYGSVHRGAGQHSKATTEKYDRARETIRNFVGASQDDYVLFTKNTTESINQAASLFSDRFGFVLVSDIEHSSNLLPWLKHGRLKQYRTDENGIITIDNIEKAIKENNFGIPLGLIAVTGASNVTGYKPIIYDIAEFAHHNHARMFVDVCQLIPHENVDMLPAKDSRHLDFIAFSGHKMYAPYGIGVLIGSKGFFDAVFPYQIGGGNLTYITSDLEIKRPFTERVHDAGTPNTIGVLALEEAINQLENIGMESIREYEHGLVELALEHLKGISNVKVYLGKEHGTVIPFDIEGLPHKLVAEVLANEYGVGARAGSFCTYELIRKLKGLTIKEERKIAKEIDRGVTANINGVVRSSFSICNNLEDMRRFTSAVREIATRNLGFYMDRYSMNHTTGEWSSVSY